MSKQLTQSTQQAYVLSLNVITQDNGQYTITPIPLLRLTQLILIVWSILRTLNRTRLLAHAITHRALNLCESFYLLVEAARTLAENPGRKLWQKTMAGNQGGAL